MNTIIPLPTRSLGHPPASETVLQVPYVTPTARSSVSFSAKTTSFLFLQNMRTITIRWASSLSKASIDLQEARKQLYPPISLFRQILRAHTKLPKEMRLIGDNYVKDEFRRHKTTSNPLHIIGFLKEWKIYLDTIRGTENPEQFRGKKLDAELFEKMSDDQIQQLYEVMHSTKEIWHQSDNTPDPPGHTTKDPNQFP